MRWVGRHVSLNVTDGSPGDGMNFIGIEWRLSLKIGHQHMVQLMLYQAIVKRGMVLKVKQLFQAMHIVCINP